MNLNKPPTNVIKPFYFVQWFSGVFSEISDKKKWISMVQTALYCFYICNSFNYFAPCEQQYFYKYACNKIRYTILFSKIPWAYISFMYDKIIIGLAKRLAEKYNTDIRLAIDDTFQPKDKRSKYIAKGGKRGAKYGFSIVTSLVIVGSIQLPLTPRLAFRRETSKNIGRKYYSKIDIAMSIIDFIHSINMDEHKVVILLDSWYTASKLLKKIIDCNFTVVAALKSNRKLDGVQIRNYRFPKYKKLTDKNFRYNLATITGTLTGFKKKFRVLFSSRTKMGCDESTQRYILCSDESLKANEILSLYRKRWLIETFHQVWKKRLDMSKLQVYSKDTCKSIIKLKNVISVSILAIGFACIFAEKNSWDELALQKENSEAFMLDIALNKIREILILKKGRGENMDCKFI